MIRTACWSTNTRMMEKVDIRHFEHSMAASARRTNLSISESADLMGFSHTVISGVYRELPGKDKIEHQFSGWKWLLSDQRRLARLLQADNSNSNSNVTTKICRRAHDWTLNQTGYSSSRRPGQGSLPELWQSHLCLMCLSSMQHLRTLQTSALCKTAAFYVV